MTPTTADIRRFLVNTFSDEDLKTLCFDYFRDVYDDFTTGMTKGQMIQLLIERCVRRDALANLEAALRAERPDQYVKQFGAPTPPPVPSAIPAEIAPAGRDPRQVFISHAHQDADFAHRLAADLGSAGWRAWIAPESIQPGEKWVEAIGRGLDGSGVFVVALTPAAVASNWVRNETNAAIELDNARRGTQLHPVGRREHAPCPRCGHRLPARRRFEGRYEDGDWRRCLARRGCSGDASTLPRLPRTSEASAAGQAGAWGRVASAVLPGIACDLPGRRSARAASRAAAGPIAFDWVTIPAGEFLMGSDKTKDKLAYDDETPQHTLHLPEYRIARVPVTVAQFAAFVAATGHKTTAEAQGSAWNCTGSEWEEIKGADWAHPRGPESDVRAKQDHPVTCVSWHDALAFCKWAGVRLPTEAEWEKARAARMAASGRGEIGSRTAGCATST